MGTGYLSLHVQTGDDALPVSNAHISLWDPNKTVHYETYTDANGNTEALALEAPDKKYTLDPSYPYPAYSTWDVDVEKEKFATSHIYGVEVVDTQTSILPVKMEPLLDEPSPQTDISTTIPPVGLLIPERFPSQPRSAIGLSPYSQSDPPASGASPAESPITRALNQVVIPDYITVHLGTPTNSSARNVRIRFSDYIKNVASSEIYSTWPQNSLIANIHAIVTFAINRIYTEWYRSRGFNFDITNSTSYDQYYRDGAQVFENISKIVDDIFNVYARRRGFRNPFFTSFCNGTTVTCNGLSQWGSVALANQGMTPLQILHYYYPNDLELVASDNITGIVESYPGYALRVGSQGESVQRMQNFLNRIRVNYPLIPLISNPNGTFGTDTETAVRAFQRIFNLTPDGIIGNATWNKISFIYVGVTRLAELDSEGERETIGKNPPNVVLSQGSRGEHVRELQFILNAIAPFYDTIPTVVQDGVFGASLKNAVMEFQKTFSITPDGVVGPGTWNKLYAVYRGIYDNVIIPPAEPPSTGNAPAYPGTPLKVGANGPEVRLMQTYLNTIRIIYPSIPYLVADGIFGNNTKTAVIAFQNAFLLAPDGIIGPITWDYIVKQYELVTGGTSISLEYPGTPLRNGSAGSPVRLMQGFLAELRSPYPSLPAVTVDGIFGPNTENAVRGFQRLFGLTVDGVIGPLTWDEIIRQRNLAI